MGFTPARIFWLNRPQRGVLGYQFRRISSTIKMMVFNPITGWSTRQQFEGVAPLVPKESGKAPQHAQRFEGPRRGDTSAVIRLPAELFDDRGHLRLRLAVIPA